MSVVRVHVVAILCHLYNTVISNSELIREEDKGSGPPVIVYSRGCCYDMSVDLRDKLGDFQIRS